MVWVVDLSPGQPHTKKAWVVDRSLGQPYPAKAWVVDPSTEQPHTAKAWVVDCSPGQPHTKKAWVVDRYPGQHHINKLDIAVLTKTWLTGTEFDKTIISEICPLSYTCVHVPRKDRRGGGIAIIL